MGIKKARLQANITQQQLAEAIGVNQSSVALWETGQTLPRADKLLDIAKLLNCTIEELLKKEGE